MEPERAVIVTEPSFKPVARPLTVMDAIVFPDELQVTVFVMSWLVPSENVPVAVNCCCTPSGMVIMSGVTAIELSVALVTVNVAAFDVKAPEAAVILVEPAFLSACTVPCVGVVLLMVAIVVSDEFQVTVAVTSLVLPSSYVPLAVKNVDVFCAIDAITGLMAIETRTGTGTVKVAVPVIAPDLAVMVVIPGATLVVNPAALMVAIVVFEELQITEAVKSWLGPLE